VALTKNLVGGGVEKEHFLTLDMAKELSMVERNTKGKEARQYFIECERRAKAGPSLDVRNPATLTTIALQEKIHVANLQSASA
jgi:anti-repressor protein